MIHFFDKQYNYYVNGILDLNGKICLEEYQIHLFNMKNIEKLVIGSSITKLDSFYFSKCFNLKEIDFSNSIINKISFGCFVKCLSLKILYLPPNIICIDGFAFFGCLSLETVHQENVKIIENDSFRECISLESIFLENVEIIRNNAFYECTSLESILLKNIKKIHNNAFLKCNSLKKIEIGKFIQKIDKNAFDGHENEIEITCPIKFYSYFLKRFPNAKINQNEYLIK